MSTTRILLSMAFAFLLYGAQLLFAQNEVQLGQPVMANSPESSGESLYLSKVKPDRSLARGAEVVLVSGYEPTDSASGMTVQVNVDRPGSKVLLVLSSYDKVNWQVTASPGTAVSGILVGGYYPPTVMTKIPTKGYLQKLPYAYETENVKFKRILAQLNRLFGVERVDAFRGSYRIPSNVDISELDPRNTELTLHGPRPRVPERNFNFELLATDFSRVRWTLIGPLNEKGRAYASKGKVAVSDSGVVYRLKGSQLERLDPQTGRVEPLTLPPNFPRFSHAKDIAYDTNRELITVATLGGEGYLYRYDTIKQKWLDYRSLNNIDIFSLAFDPQGDRYVAWTRRGNLVFISGEGHGLFSREVRTRLEGFGRLYDRGNGPPPRVHLAAKEDDIAIIYIGGNRVSQIWHYSVKTENAVLTYAPYR